MMLNPLLAAIVDDNDKAVQALLRSEKELVAKTVRTAKLYDSKIFHWLYAGDTALHLAAAGYRSGIVQMLIAAGADPNAAANHRHSTPLHYAADGFSTGPAGDAGRQVATLQTLLDAGANLHAQDKNGATALHRAVRTRSAAAVRLLMQSGSDPAFKNKPGNTPFHLAVQTTGRGGSGSEAARKAQQEIIGEFLAAGVSADLKNNRGKSVRASVQSDWIHPLLP